MSPILDLIIYLVLLPLGLLLFLKPGFFYSKFTKPEDQYEENFAKSKKYSRYGGILLLVYVGLQFASDIFS